MADEGASDALEKAISQLDSIILKVSQSLESYEKKNTRVKGVKSTEILDSSSSGSVQSSSQSNGKLSAVNNKSSAKGGAKVSKANSTGENELHINFEKCLFQVGKIVSIENHPVAEKLFICKVEVAHGEDKQVVAGLRKFFSAEELDGKYVCLICNLKPAKLAGQLSEAMILAGSTKLEDGSEVVKVLQPPLESSSGDRIYLENGSVSDKVVKQLSSKIWEKIANALSVQGGHATFDGIKLVTNKGDIVVCDLPDGAEIH